MFRWKAASIVLLAWIALTSVPVFALKYIVDNTTSSVDWKAAVWTTDPADPKENPGIVPCTPITAMRNARPGDIVFFRGGENGSYNPAMNPDYSQPALNPSNSGTSGRPITFRNFANETVYLKNMTAYPNTGWHHPLIGSNGRNWIIWEGFKLSGVSNAGKVNFTDASDCILRNTEIIAVSIPSLSREQGNYDGVRIERTKRVTVQNCLIHGVDDSQNERGAGIKLYSAYNTIVEHSTFYDNDIAIFDKNDGQHNTFRLNFIRTGTSTPGAAIYIGTHAGGPDTRDIKVYQNVIVTAPGSDGIESTPIVHDLQIFNNVIYSNKGRGLNITETTNQQYWNNIFVNATTPIRIRGRGEGMPTYSSYNAFYNGQGFIVRDYEADSKVYSSLAAWQGSGELIGGGNPDAQSIYANPKFIDPGSTSPEGYKLKADSPCRKSGKDSKDMGAWPEGSLHRKTPVRAIDRQSFHQSGGTSEVASASNTMLILVPNAPFHR